MNNQIISQVFDKPLVIQSYLEKKMKIPNCPLLTSVNVYQLYLVYFVPSDFIVAMSTGSQISAFSLGMSNSYTYYNWCIYFRNDGQNIKK